MLWCGAVAGQRDAIGFAEKVLELLDEGRYTATYKYAVLLALIDLCLEGTQTSGAPPAMVTTRQLADKIVELYWPHTAPFASRASARILSQNTRGQAEIVSAILGFRSRHAPDASAPRWHARLAAPAAYERLVRTVEWKLIEMPLPRLQMMGQSLDPFIYEIHWDARVQRRDVERAAGFDNRVLLKPRVGDYLLQLNGLLRPLIQRRWAAMVAQLNRLEDSQLEAFLFGADRVQTARIRAGLWEIQGCRCFYCDVRLGDPARSQVDHFVPWSRYPDDSLDNLVVADVACNGFKSSSLAAADGPLGPPLRGRLAGASAARRPGPADRVGARARQERERGARDLSPASGRCPALATPPGVRRPGRGAAGSSARRAVRRSIA